ncbi:MAG: hypothetical protein ACKV2V_29525 [Blastocatellia bacterium]
MILLNFMLQSQQNLLLLAQQTATSSLRTWLFFLALGGICFVICRFQYWFLPIALIFEGALSFGFLSALRDPKMQAALAESAPTYAGQAYAAMVIALLAPCLGSFLGWRTRRKTPQ